MVLMMMPLLSISTTGAIILVMVRSTRLGRVVGEQLPSLVHLAGKAQDGGAQQRQQQIAAPEVHRAGRFRHVRLPES
jgi:hypothetical protein